MKGLHLVAAVMLAILLSLPGMDSPALAARAGQSREAPAVSVSGPALKEGVGNSSGPDARHDPRFMPPSELKRGMRGVLKTVVEGTRVESLEVEILDVIPDAVPAGDLIMIQASESFLERVPGFASGMSGSPVYVDGRLIGAFAYTFALADHTVGFVTPIQYMLDLLDMLETSGEGLGPGMLAQAPAGAQSNGGAPALALSAGGGEGVGVSTVAFQTPLMTSGFSRRGLERLRADLAPFNLLPVQAGGLGPPPAGDPPPLEPGSAIGIQLVRGDVNATSIGTVTYIDENNRFLALGHGFLQRGELGAVATAAYIHRIIPSLQSPFKLGSPLQPIGVILQDRNAGVAGRLGQEVPMVRLNVHVRDRDLGREKTYRMELVNDEALLTSLLVGSTLSVVDRGLDRVGRGTAQVFFEIIGDGLPAPFTRSNLFYSEVDVAAVSLLELVESVYALVANPFRDVRIQEINVFIDVERERRTARIEDARPYPQRARPGDTVEVEVTLRPFRRNTVKERVTIQIPKNVSPGTVGVVVRSGGWGSEEPSEEERPEVPEEGVSNLAMLVENLANRERNNDLVVEFYPRREGPGGSHDNGLWEQEPPESLPDEPFPDAEGDAQPGPHGNGFHSYEEGSIRRPSAPSGGLEPRQNGEPRRPPWEWNRFGPGERVFSTRTTPYVLTGSTAFELVIVGEDEPWVPPSPPRGVPVVEDSGLETAARLEGAGVEGAAGAGTLEIASEEGRDAKERPREE